MNNTTRYYPCRNWSNISVDPECLKVNGEETYTFDKFGGLIECIIKASHGSADQIIVLLSTIDLPIFISTREGNDMEILSINNVPLIPKKNLKDIEHLFLNKRFRFSIVPLFQLDLNSNLVDIYNVLPLKTTQCNCYGNSCSSAGHDKFTYAESPFSFMFIYDDHFISL
ncbi:hypothetical protein RclHR1_07970006 [Rhizophagus clarus]|uniref:Uncharacterized protein n=1 Tax=Rhizophagus clarus TaxID=94130 RepID=A0A2Z6RZ84_9GLOM|nr:hypothetical protein RclHR1_07970006 [Rhizophagus clarus]GES98177.1 hypothetical protein RCL_jg16436.t1 [Rhizophagus clarus]